MATAPWLSSPVPASKVPTSDVRVDPNAPNAPWLEQPDQSIAEQGVATGNDILTQLLAGPRRAYEGLAGTGGDVYNLEFALADYLARKFGASPETLNYIKEQSQIPSTLPSSGEVNKATSEYIGPTPEAKTGVGQVVGTAAEYATNPSKGFVRNVVAPTIGTEVGGFIGEEYDHETLGRLIGGVGGGAATGLTERGLVGPQVSEERKRLAKILADEGVDITAGQLTGRKALRYAETGPYETKPAGIKEKQGRQFNRAALKKAGIDADEVTPDVLAAADDAFGVRYDDVVARAGGVPLDGDLETALLQNVDDYERLAGYDGSPAVSDYFKRISDAAQKNNNMIPADVFKQISSEISRDLRKLRGNPQGNAELMETLREFKSSMFDSIGRNGNPQVVADWKKLNGEYRNYKDIERSMYGPGEATKEGMISPAKLGTSVAAGDKAGTLREKGDLSGQAKAGQLLMTDLPQSGTTPRMLIPGTLAAMGSQIGDMDAKSMAGIALGAIAPAGVSSALTSKPVRTALINRATNPSSFTGPLPLLNPQTALLASLMAKGDQERRGGGGPR